MKTSPWMMPVLLAALTFPGVSLAQAGELTPTAAPTALPGRPLVRPGQQIPRPYTPGAEDGATEGATAGAGAGADAGAVAGPEATAGPSAGGVSAAPKTSTSASGATVLGDPARQKPPKLRGAGTKVSIDGTFSLEQLVKFFADLTGQNFILTDPKNLRDEVTIISHQEVSVEDAYEAFLQALSLTNYTVVTQGKNTTLIKTSEASQSPIMVGSGGEDLASSARYVTQIIPLDNVSVSDVQSVVSAMVGPSAKVISYAPSNTMIITDSSRNLQKVYSIIKELDIAAPKSRMEIMPIRYADASEIQQIIQELYGTADTSSPATTAAATRSSARTRRTAPKVEAPTNDAVTAGKESNYISKVMADERTNSLIVLANDQGMLAVRDLIGKLDVDVDMSSRSQIHVVYLEHAKAEDVAQVLSNLSQNRSGSSSTRTTGTTRPGTTARNAASTAAPKAEGEAGEAGAIAAFDSGMRITSDENTNSLVIIASPEDFRIVKSVIDQLDVRRRQVFVDAVILELSSDDTLEIGTAVHGPFAPTADLTGIVAGQFGTQSLGLSQDLLSGLAMGVFGESVSVPMADGSSLDVPAFGVVMNFLKTNSGTNIVSNPNLLTLDNEEAKITVGRKVPFPTQSGLNSLGQPVVSYQREDVAVSLEITPRVNSTNFVTLELVMEASEIEEDDKGLDVNSSGFITSKREVETTALVRDNQTVVLGGLVGVTENQVETKIPVLGDLPVVGALFRGSRNQARKSNLMIFITPHIIDDEEDIWEIMRVKEAQRQEFLRRFYGQSREKQITELQELLRFSMNGVDQPSMFRGPTQLEETPKVEGQPISDESRAAVEEALSEHRGDAPGAGAGRLPEDEPLLNDLPEQE
ncbi:MAG: type II secretion system secretin GspD [Deltaproteobacteria bacterium]|nr:type II secretion system secretin GspD [Deltaproteobacteria bacterium]